MLHALSMQMLTDLRRHEMLHRTKCSKRASMKVAKIMQPSSSPHTNNHPISWSEMSSKHNVPSNSTIRTDCNHLSTILYALAHAPKFLTKLEWRQSIQNLQRPIRHPQSRIPSTLSST